MKSREDKFEKRCAQWKTKWDTLDNSPGFYMQPDNTAKVLTLLMNYACYSESVVSSSLSKLFKHPKRNYITEVEAVISEYYASENSRNIHSEDILPWYTNRDSTILHVLTKLKQQLNGNEPKWDGDLSAILFVINGATNVDFRTIQLRKFDATQTRRI